MFWRSQSGDPTRLAAKPYLPSLHELFRPAYTKMLLERGLKMLRCIRQGLPRPSSAVPLVLMTSYQGPDETEKLHRSVQVEYRVYKVKAACNRFGLSVSRLKLVK